MNNLIQTVDGYKTYLVCTVGIAVILMNQFVGHVPGTPPADPNWLNNIYSLILVATGRSAIGKIQAPRP